MGAGEIIRQRREELGLSGRELARLARVDQGHLSRVETGQTRASAAFCAQVARVLGLKLTDLYAEDEPAGGEPLQEDPISEIRAILIRGHWPPLAREGIVNIVRATFPGGVGLDNAKSFFLQGVH